MTPRTPITRRTLAAGAILAVLAAALPTLAQTPVEVVFATFLDPNNRNDPRAAAQTRMIEAFERANPTIKIKVQVDPNQGPSFRALRAKSSTPDVLRFTNFSMLEAANTGSIVKLDEWIKRDGVSETDWLLPIAATRVKDGYYGLQQDYRIPVLLHRKSLVQRAGIATLPRTWAEVCAEGGKANRDNIIGYALPLGSSGGIGGAQPLAENLFSSMVSEDSGKYFAPDGRDIAFSRDDFIRTAQTIKDLYTTCKATPNTAIQFGYNEVHDGLRAGTIAMATFGLFRFRAIETGGAGDDLGWAPPPAFKADGKMVVYGFQLTVNANSTVQQAAWEFVKFLGGPQAQAIAAEGGEVVARASVYTDPALARGVSDRQRAWSQLVKERGRFVDYSILSVNFHEILGQAMQRMILSNGTPEAAWTEVSGRYAEALRRAQ